jgi:hypothetical protein
MAGLLKDKPISALIVAAIIGIIIGSYLNAIFEMLPGAGNVVKTFFTYSFPIGIGDFVHDKPVLIDLAAIKFQIGFQIKFSLLSIIGLVISLYMFRWYR